MSRNSAPTSHGFRGVHECPGSDSDTGLDVRTGRNATLEESVRSSRSRCPGVQIPVGGQTDTWTPPPLWPPVMAPFRFRERLHSKQVAGAQKGAP